MPDIVYIIMNEFDPVLDYPRLAGINICVQNVLRHNKLYNELMTLPKVPESISKLLINAIHYDKYLLVEYLLSMAQKYKHNNYAIKYQRKYGKIYEWLWSVCYHDIYHLPKLCNKIISYACEFDSLSTLIHLFKNNMFIKMDPGTESDILQSKIIRAIQIHFIRACDSGSLGVASYIYTIYYSEIRHGFGIGSYDFLLETRFSLKNGTATNQNRLDIIIWLYNLHERFYLLNQIDNNPGLNIFNYANYFSSPLKQEQKEEHNGCLLDYIFTVSCQFGHIDIVR